MKKLTIIKILLCVLLVCPMVGITKSDDVYASSEFVVKYIENNGSLTSVESFSDFASAKAKMAENPDYVVTCESSLSPSKIVAMNSGLVYSYPTRSGSKTTTIYETVDSSLIGGGTTVSVASNYEMTYLDTYSTTYSSSKGYQMGWVKVVLNGFTGYIDLEYTDLVPSKYIRNGIAITLGGYPGNSYSVICKQKYYTAMSNGNYNDLIIHYYLGLPNGSNENAKSYALAIGVAPSFMEEGTAYYSNDGINFYSDDGLTNLVGTYYNYYQFVPARSYSKISGDTLNAYVAAGCDDDESVMLGTGNDFITDQNAYGVNGTLIFAMAIHESGYGTSTISKSKYNLFGWGSYDDDTSASASYSSVLDCVKSQMADNLSNYLDESSKRYYWSMGLGNKGGGFALKYGSDPYWPEKIAAFYYDIDKFANDDDGNLTDYNSYSLALVTTKGANVYVSANESGGVWYTTQNKATGYQKNLITIVLENDGDFVKVQTSNNIDASGLLKPIEKPSGYIAPYNANTSVGYMKSSDIQFINTATGSVPTISETNETNETDEETENETVEVSSITAKISEYGYLGKSEESFIKALNDLGFTNLVKDEEGVYSSRSVGVVGAYTPDGEQSISTPIKYYLSLGPYTTSLANNDFVGKTSAEANELINQDKFSLLGYKLTTTKTTTTKYADDTLYDCTVSGKKIACKLANNASGTTSGETSYINPTKYAGKSESAFKTALTSLGFTNLNKEGEVYSKYISSGNVAYYDPDGNQDTSTTINYWLSLGKFTSEQANKDFNGLTVSEANAKLATFKYSYSNISSTVVTTEEESGNYTTGTLYDCSYSSNKVACKLAK